MASMMNCAMMLRFFAPMARRMPISRVRSVTETSMMFMMPMPAASSAMELTSATPMRTGEGEGIELRDQRIVGDDFKIVLLARRHLADDAHDAAHLLHGVVICAWLARLHQDVQAAVPAAVTVQAGGDADDRKIVLVAARAAAFGFQHADHRVFDAVNLDLLANGEP